MCDFANKFMFNLIILLILFNNLLHLIYSHYIISIVILTLNLKLFYRILYLLICEDVYLFIFSILKYLLSV